MQIQYGFAFFYIGSIAFTLSRSQAFTPVDAFVTNDVNVVYQDSVNAVLPNVEIPFPLVEQIAAHRK
ncbi:MAG TPA: hypothetical protein ENJ95_23160 [Bacteroidetes bacterium]|nr:hypothetical protein [Bacteroidota bacterium]